MGRFFINMGLLALLALPLGAAIYQLSWMAPRGPEGEVLGWADAESKLLAAQALNGTVRIRGFRALTRRVESGENFWAIAQKFKIDVDTICGFNPELESLAARLGKVLIIPNLRGVMHQVRESETVASLARLYEVEEGSIESANRLGFFGPSQGQLVFIPRGRPKRVSKALGAAYAKRSLFRSPLAGGLSSTMGARSDPFTGAVTHHSGIDIKAGYDDFVGAAAEGIVILAGWNGGFGKCVKIDHGNGHVTLYGHLNSIKVRHGQRVRRHQLLGRVGSTGRATGPHLHFSIYMAGRPVNPLNYIW